MEMASASIIHCRIFTFSVPSPKCSCRNQTLALNPSSLLSSKSLLKLKQQSLHSKIRINKLALRKSYAVPSVYAAQSSLFKVLKTVWKVGKDGIEAGTELVPGSIPRPIARISVAAVGVFLALFVLKSFISTAFFVLAVMGLIYFGFLALNKDEGSKSVRDETPNQSPSSTEDSLEEARRIMEKYK